MSLLPRHPHRRRVLLLGVGLALVAAPVLAACSGSSSGGSSTSAASGSAASGEVTVTGSTSGIADLTTAEIISRMKTAAKAASSVTIKGGIDSGTSKSGLDLQLSKDGSQGTISEGDVELKLVVTPAMVYVQAPADFYKSRYGEAAATLLSGKWLGIPATDKAAADYEPFKSSEAFLTNFLGSVPDTLEKGQTGVINGIPALALTGSAASASATSSDSGATVWVATIGQPYPLQVAPNSGGGKVDFLDWNKPVTINPPPAAEVVDISKLGTSTSS